MSFVSEVFYLLWQTLLQSVGASGNDERWRTLAWSRRVDARLGSGPETDTTSVVVGGHRSPIAL